MVDEKWVAFIARYYGVDFCSLRLMYWYTDIFDTLRIFYKHFDWPSSVTATLIKRYGPSTQTDHMDSQR